MGIEMYCHLTTSSSLSNFGRQFYQSCSSGRLNSSIKQQNRGNNFQSLKARDNLHAYSLFGCSHEFSFNIFGQRISSSRTVVHPYVLCNSIHRTSQFLSAQSLLYDNAPLQHQSSNLGRWKFGNLPRPIFDTDCCKCSPRDVEFGGGPVLEEPWEGISTIPISSRQKDERISNHLKLSLKVQAVQDHALTSARPRNLLEDNEALRRRMITKCLPVPRDTPPKRDTGIASEKDWGINLKNEISNESGVNPDGSTWYRESGEDVGDNGYRCRWTIMGGRNADGSSEWKEAWWEKSDWTGYKELGAEKSGKNAQGDSWWETWQEILRQDDWSNLARIEKSAEKQATSGFGAAGWYEKWWEKYNAKGWTEKGAHKYGRLNDQAWWEKWGEQYDGRGAVLKWTDKWAENSLGEKWGDKWEEKFEAGLGGRQGETWHYAPGGERWSRTWGEEHFGNGSVHKYGKSTSGESWDDVVTERTFYEAEPHYGWADAIGHSTQLLSIEQLERPPGVYPDLDFGPSESSLE